MDESRSKLIDGLLGRSRLNGLWVVQYQMDLGRSKLIEWTSGAVEKFYSNGLWVVRIDDDRWGLVEWQCRSKLIEWTGAFKLT